VIAFHRPCSLEAAAGKNPVGHVGKIYNALAQQVAERVHAEVPGLEEVRATLVSRIGSPLREPWIASLELVPAPGAAPPDLEAAARSVLERELDAVGSLVEDLVAGRRPVC
jgi:S-adenosylmethionine synthetase